MGYCTTADVREMLKEEMLTVILSDDQIENGAEREARIEQLLAQAVADADAEIDGYIAKRYTVPFPAPPAILGKLAKDIAAYNMVSRVGISEQDRDKTFLTRYNAAIKYLQAVAMGKIELGVDSPTQMARTNVQMHSSPRIFDRNKMRGW